MSTEGELKLKQLYTAISRASPPLVKVSAIDTFCELFQSLVYTCIVLLKKSEIILL